MIPVIICGGVGTKMWPESSPAHPKHFLPLIDGKSLFELNWQSLRKKFGADEIYLQTNPLQAEIAKKLVSEVVADNIFIEPETRNQGPATGLAAAQLVRRGRGDEVFMLIQVDDLRQPEEKLFEMMDVCQRLAKETGKYITGGFRPEFVVMGNDFLVKGDRVSREDEVGIYKVAEFIWRGNKEEREDLIKSDKVLLHTNHTCMTARGFLEMFKKYRPDWYEPLMNIVEGGRVREEYAKMPVGPLEEVTQLVYQAGEALVVELPFEWIDFGTWESMAKYLERKAKIKNQNLIEIGGENNFVRSGKPVGIIGLSDLCVIESEEGILVCPKSQSGRVGEIVKELSK